MMSEVEYLSAIRKRLRQAIEHLAMPATLQRTYLAELGVMPLVDELALEFDDAFRPVKGFPDKLQFADSVYDILVRIDQLLDEMSTRKSESGAPWRWEDLDQADSWANLRTLATRVLKDMQAE